MKQLCKKGLAFVLMFIFVNAFILSPINGVAAVDGNSMNPGYKTYLMAPLKKVTDYTTWEAFENDLRKAKQNGFYAVTVDFWWGDMEKNGDQIFGLYKRFDTTIDGKGWDGKIGGTLQSSNVFVWMVSAVDYLGKPFFAKGTVTLIR